ncbi:MAG: endolytic transglycosylase MltG [Oscillospiraceae bacterium]|nr:endolytic transglycosylase MltG [Oscillospiraceae bacterium]
MPDMNKKQNKPASETEGVIMPSIKDAGIKNLQAAGKPVASRQTGNMMTVSPQGQKKGPVSMKPRPPAPPPDEYDDEDEDDEYEEYEERDFRPVRLRRDGKTGCLGGLMYAVFVISISIILACMGWMAASDVLALHKEPMTITVVIPREIFTYEKETDEDGNTKTVSRADIDYVASLLKDSGIIEYTMLFKLYSAISDASAKIDPGSYELNTEFDYRALVKKMQFGSESMLETKVTIPEGFTMAQIFERLVSNRICSAEDLYEAAANYNYNYSFLGDAEIGDAARLEGFLFPDTYYFYQGEQASNVLNRFLRNMYNKITDEMQNAAQQMELSFREVIIIASMIESEAADDDERDLVASVIYNRLRVGMPLEIDATIQYVLPERKPNLSEADLMTDSPYNTYLHTGLPPGAISNPGIPSVEAALDPASTDWFFYALNTETGSHEFFRTYDEFSAFVETQDYSVLWQR